MAHPPLPYQIALYMVILSRNDENMIQLKFQVTWGNFTLAHPPPSPPPRKGGGPSFLDSSPYILNKS